MLDCRVLGQLEVWAGPSRVAVGGVLPRRLMTALVAADGRAVPDDRLVDLVWAGAAPAQASRTLQVYVSRLRGALGAGHRERLVRDQTGYRLRLDPDAVDAHRFAAGVDSGRRLLANGRATDAVPELTRALELWRGEPYQELAGSDLVDATRGRLVELRELALEERAAARLAAGDVAGAVAELEELVRAAPLRERRWGQLVLGLYRSDRQADALAVLRRVRALLADELGVDPGPELRELERRVLAHDPTLGPAAGRRGQAVQGLRPMTAFIGRDSELASIAERLRVGRLVSLVGPAGVGKTRLAIEYLRSAEGATWFARLADVRQPAELPGVIADVVGLVAVTGDPVTAVVDTIGAGSGLLVLDNCEHLTEAAAALAAELLARCPRLGILATTREPLGLDGEVTLGIAPLATDGAAVELLVDRVRAIRPDWVPTGAELDQARRISRQLDGLPLAIELAAARTRVLGLAEIADRLGDRFALLGAVPRGSVTAHATLQAAIGSSVDLLPPQDRALLSRLWPFEGGFTLAAAEAVRPAGSGPVLESLSSLVNRSVVVADTGRTPSRYLLLESIRAYCESIDPDPAASREAHAGWVRELAARCFVEIRRTRGGQFLRVLADELPNVRAGLSYDVEHSPAEAVRSAGRLGLFFSRGLHNAEALRLVRTVLAAGDRAPALDRARLVVILDALVYLGGDTVEAHRIVFALADLVAEFRADEDPTELAEVLFHVAFSAVQTGHPELAAETAERAVAIGARHELRWLVRAASTVRDVAMVLAAHRAGDEDEVIRLVRAARLPRSGWTAAWSHSVLAEVYLRYPGPGRAAEALAEVRLALELYLAEEDTPYALGVLYLGALALARNGRPDDGVRLLAAVQDHASRLRLMTPTFFEAGTAWVEALMADLPRGLDGGRLDWQRMIDLLHAL